MSFAVACLQISCVYICDSDVVALYVSCFGILVHNIMLQVFKHGF